jgi:hypothetical protein
VKYLFGLLLFYGPFAGAVTCGPIVSSLIRSVPIVNSIASGASVQADECVPVKAGAEIYLINLVVLDDPKSGMQSRILIFKEKGLSVNSRPVFLSAALGLDSFPIQFNGQNRMLLILASDRQSVRMLLNTQTGPHANLLAEWTFDFAQKSFKPIANRKWMIDSNHFPKAIKQKNIWHLQLDDKIIDL